MKIYKLFIQLTLFNFLFYNNRMERFFKNIVLTTKENFNSQQSEAARTVLFAEEQRKNNSTYPLPICILKPPYSPPVYDPVTRTYRQQTYPHTDIWNTYTPGSYGSELRTGQKIFYDHDFHENETREKEICRDFKKLKSYHEQDQERINLQNKEREIKERNEQIILQQNSLHSGSRQARADLELRSKILQEQQDKAIQDAIQERIRRETIELQLQFEEDETKRAIAREQEAKRRRELEEKYAHEAYQRMLKENELILERSAALRKMKKNIQEKLDEKRRIQKQIRDKYYINSIRLDDIVNKKSLNEKNKNIIIRTNNDNFYNMMQKYKVPLKNIPEDVYLDHLNLTEDQEIAKNILLKGGVVTFI